MPQKRTRAKRNDDSCINYDAKRGKWRVRIRDAGYGNYRHLGYFDDEKSAKIAGPRNSNWRNVALTSLR